MNFIRAVTRSNLLTVLPWAGIGLGGGLYLAACFSKATPKDFEDISRTADFRKYRYSQIQDAKYETAVAGDDLMYYRILNESLPKPVDSLRKALNTQDSTLAARRYRARRVENSHVLARETQTSVAVSDLAGTFEDCGTEEMGSSHARMVDLVGQWKRMREADRIRKPAPSLEDKYKMERVG